MFTRHTLASLALAGFAATAAAAPPTDESLRTLFAVSKAEAVLDSMYAALEPAMRQGMAQAAQGQTLSAEQQRVLERAPQRLAAVLRTELSWDKMLPTQMAIFRESFDQAEVDGLIAFYKSPVGQSFVNKMPAVQQKAMTAVQGHMQQVLPRIKAAMDEVLAEAKLPVPK